MSTILSLPVSETYPLTSNYYTGIPMKYIYLYTTPTYKLKNWYKIGETVISPQERIRQQDNASNPEELLLVSFWSVSQNLSDKQVHSQLESLDFNKLRGNREWFELSDTPIEDVETAISNIDTSSIKHPITTEFNIPVLHYTEIWWAK